MKQQRTTLAPPLAEDKSLADFAAVAQSNLEDLFQFAHIHPVRTTAPAANEGNVGDIFIVSLTGTFYIYAKVSTTSWLRTVLS